jgi:DNA-binding CsgD family transcriptional regulator
MNRIETARLKAEIAQYFANGLRNKDICKLLGIYRQQLNYYKNKILKGRSKKIKV